MTDLEPALRRACLLEAAARKPGNVHPQAAFADLCYRDFVLSADVVAPVLARTRQLGVGRTVAEAVARTREAVGRNTNLGIVLLLAPLAAVDPRVPLRDGIGHVLESLTCEDARAVYQAIRIAQPGGMGQVPREDLAQEPAGTLLEVMRLAVDRDAVARQYATRFELVLEAARELPAACVAAAPWPRAEGSGTEPMDAWEETVIRLHLELMARQPDTLILRKCGPEAAQRSARLAREVLDAGWPRSSAGRDRLRRLDLWLRAAGNRRNPGTTADLVAACLFAALRDGAPVALQPCREATP